MLPGPVFNVELVTSARRTRYYVVRFFYGLILFFFIWRNDPLFSPWYYPSAVTGLSFQDMARLGQAVFNTFLIVQSIAVLLITPALVAGVIADEKQRKTLHYLLASRLSSSEIILGKLAARVLHIAVFVAIGVPIMSLVSLFGGVDPMVVVLAFVVTISTAFFLSAFSILMSVHARRPREAISFVYILELAWLYIPPMVRLLMPMAGTFWMRLYEWVRPINEWIAPTSPLSLLFAGRMGARSSQGLLSAGLWTIGLQLAYGVLFLLIAVLRLRPVFRKEGDGGHRFALTRALQRKGRVLPRPECGDDAMWWKERFVSRTSVTTKAASTVVVVITVCGLAYLTYDYARPAFRELWVYGYGAVGRMVDRDEFNSFLRMVATLIYVLWCLGVASASSSGITSEREEDTWISLVTTPLDGWEILRAKMFGAVWGLRWVGALLVLLWIVALAAGSIHPFGFFAVALETVVYLWFVTALGTYVSLRSKSSGRALVTTVGILILANGAYMMCCIPLRPSSTLLYFGITPLVEAASLKTYDEVRLFFGGGNYELESILTGFISVLSYVVAAALLTRAAVGQFEVEVGRPRRRFNASRATELALDDVVGEDDETVLEKSKPDDPIDSLRP